MYNRYILKGSDYEMGVKAGKIFMDPINKEIGIYEELLKDEDKAALTDRIEAHIKKDLPRCLEEIYGRADGAGVDRKALVLFYSPEVYTKADACTTAVYKKKDRVLFSHNEDDVACDHENRNLIRFDYGDFCLTGLSDYHKLTGSAFGYNSHGLVFSCNYLFHEVHDLNNLSRYIVTRYIVESRSIEECMERLRKYKPASAFSYNVLDTNTGEVINVENDLDDMYVTKIEGKFARSNHFLNKEGGARPSENSLNRYKTANERIAILDERAILTDLRQVLRYEDEEYVKSIFMDPQKYWTIDNTVTIANFSVDSLTKKVIVFDGFDHSEYEFTMDGFEGEEIK